MVKRVCCTLCIAARYHVQVKYKGSQPPKGCQTHCLFAYLPPTTVSIIRCFGVSLSDAGAVEPPQPHGLQDAEVSVARPWPRPSRDAKGVASL